MARRCRAMGPAVAGAVVTADLPGLSQAILDECPVLRPPGHARFEHQRRSALPFAVQMQAVLAYRHEVARSGPLLGWWSVDPGKHICSCHGEEWRCVQTRMGRTWVEPGSAVLQ